MINIVITSYKEPKSTVRAVNAFLRQKINVPYKIIVVDPFPEVEDYLNKHVKSQNVEFFPDPGEGKSYALNLILGERFSNSTEDIFIFTDGDVYVSDNSVSEIIKAFEDKSVGCVTGRPIAIDSKDTKYGYWANMFFQGIHRTRERLYKENKFFECSGYLFAIKNGVIRDFPLETSEDSIIPYLFWKAGYKIAYAPKAEVYVKNPGSWKDWLAQKKRNVKGHENLNRIAPDMPRTKSLWNEIKWGTFFALKYPQNLKEFWWTIEAFFARLYLYMSAFADLGKKKRYKDAWRGEAITESTKTLD